MLAAVAEMERNLLVEWTQAVLQRTIAEGRRLGRPSKATQEQQEIRHRLRHGESVSATTRLYGVSTTRVLFIRSERQAGHDALL